MVAFNQKRQCGSGIMDTSLKPFVYAKYPGEQHAINENGIPYNFYASWITS